MPRQASRTVAPCQLFHVPCLTYPVAFRYGTDMADPRQPDTTPVLPAEYELRIERRVVNPEWSPKRGPYDREVEPYLERAVTNVTLDPEQWRKVQAAIVEALK